MDETIWDRDARAAAAALISTAIHPRATVVPAADEVAIYAARIANELEKQRGLRDNSLRALRPTDPPPDPGTSP
jgi:hypothetical protein